MTQDSATFFLVNVFLNSFHRIIETKNPDDILKF
jgi:hypothetical protein